MIHESDSDDCQIILPWRIFAELADGALKRRGNPLRAFRSSVVGGPSTCDAFQTAHCWAASHHERCPWQPGSDHRVGLQCSARVDIQWKA